MVRSLRRRARLVTVGFSRGQEVVMVSRLLITVGILLGMSACGGTQPAQEPAVPAGASPAGGAPVFEYDPTWPEAAIAR